MISRKKWVEDFQTVLLQTEKDFEGKEFKPVDKKTLDDMKTVCSELLLSLSAKPGLFGMPSLESMKHVHTAKSVTDGYFYHNLLMSVPTGPLTVAVLTAYRDFADGWKQVDPQEKPRGVAAMLLPNYELRSQSITEFLKNPHAYVASAVQPTFAPVAALQPQV